MTTQLKIETFPNEAAIAYINGKAVADPENFGNLPPQLKQRAFVVAGIEKLNVVKEIREAVAKLPQGASWDAAKKEIAEKISPFVGDGGMDAAARDKAAKARAEFLLRTHGFQAYSVARHQQQMETTKRFPYWKYETVGDNRVRAGHAALDGKVLRADDPWWKTHYPPWDWGCRCIVIALDEEDAQEIGISEHNDMPTPDQSKSYSFDPTNISLDIDKFRDDPMFKNNPTNWENLFVAPAKTVKTETPDGRGMNMWQYSLEQASLKTAKALVERTNASKDRFETAATISGKTGRRLSFAVGDKSHTDLRIPKGEDAIVVHTHPSGSSAPSYIDLKTFLDIANGQETFHYIVGVPHPRTGKPIRIRRVVMTGKTVPKPLQNEMAELDKLLNAKDEWSRELAKLQQCAILIKIRESGCIEWEREI